MSDWIGFVCLTGTTFILAFKLFNFKPPERNCLYYFGDAQALLHAIAPYQQGDLLKMVTGYNEHGMASMYVNMFAATAYYAKICSHLSGNKNSDTSVTNYQVLSLMCAPAARSIRGADGQISDSTATT